MLAFILSGLAARAADTSRYFAYFGTYTGGKSKGIYVSRFDAGSGKLAPVELAVETTSPSFLAVHPNGKFLYAVGEISNYGGRRAGVVSAFAIEPADGRLGLLNQQSSMGAGPCHLVVDASGKAVLVANYGGGSVAALRLKADGRLGEATAFVQHKGASVNQQRQQGPHGHCIVADPANRFALACDLGLDQVLVYRFDPAQASLVAHEPPSASLKPGSGPRHMAFHPSGRFAYVINEILCTMTAFAYDAARGELKEVQTLSTLPEDETVKAGYSTAEVEVHPTGRFLYGSNRGHDTIVVFAIDSTKGTLKPLEHVSTQGKIPRSFGIDPTGAWLLAANQNSNTVVVFRIDPKTGQITPAGQVLEVGSPVCVRFVPAKPE